ncbi:hypothetical protein LY90DRAFT_646782 [Neocallimastix californiae]|uniref:EGF-like domain-containing protein n=1 Tax=Neocallimastix californiae TaxID=1754190 RepID=A0A1Y2D677_9FUNG|nr:hypothetical protein LY90DRAFT_646782 [Neocallimastix californiae]|eukprot:ORY54793.1 hypothetical protein LY90DRAFT_646782 [Neocallimastix californiae]
MNYLKLFIINIILILKCFSVDIYIQKDGYDFSNIKDTIISYASKYNDINIYINYDYYIISITKLIEITVPANTNISFIGNPSNSTKTIIDFIKSPQNLVISFEQYTNQQLIFENIEFTNYYHERASEKTSIIYSIINSVKYNILIRNCIFSNSNSIIFKLDSENFKYENEVKYIIHFDKCKFINIINNGVIFMNNKGNDVLNNSGILISNSEFSNCSDFAMMDYGYLKIEYCVFTQLTSKLNVAIFNKMRYDSVLIIENSIFHDINAIDNTAPFITTYGNSISFYNVTMKNVHNKIGYLIYNNQKKKEIENLTFDLSTFEDISTLITGDNAHIYIQNSTFNNIKNPNTFAAITDSKYSKNYITNCEIKDINLYGSSLFNSQSKLVIANSSIKNVSTNYKPIFDIKYNNLEFRDSDIENIKLFGDSDKTFFISYEGEEKQNSIIFENVNISNINSNGNVIKIYGNDVAIQFKNTVIKDSISYGSFLNSEANNISFIADNLNFQNVMNGNKIVNGVINLQNNINIKIENSIFENNESHSNGGLIFLDDINGLEILIHNSKFLNNLSYSNGGVIYINDKNTIENENENENINSIIIQDSSFENNTAKYFGGVLYTNINEFYNLNIKNNEFINNYAQVAGGVLFLKNINDNVRKIDKDLNLNNKFKDNISLSHGNITATHPTNIIFAGNKTEITEIYPGASLYFTIELKDELNNTVTDREKYYSDIGISIELKDHQMNEVNPNDYLFPNIVSSFINGLNIIQYFKIYSKNIGTFYLQITPKTTSLDDLANYKLLYKLNIKDCNSDLIKITNNEGIFHCESPICMNCNTTGNFECIKYKDEINDYRYNQCICKKGYYGETCSDMIFNSNE